MPKIKTIPLLEVIFKNNGGTSDIWKAVSELLYNKEDEISVFCPYIKNKINSYDKDTSILALTLLDFCVDDGKMPLWSALNTKNFFGSIINNLKTREETEVQNMILYLIQKWGKKFSKYKELSNFTDVYNLMKKNNISFPTQTNHNYSKYVKLPKNYKLNKETSLSNNFNDISNKKTDNNSNQIIVETDPEDYLKDINVNLNTSNYDKIYKRLVNKLYDWTHSIHETNVLINQNNDGKNNKNIESLCKDLEKGNRQLIDTIQSGKLKDKVLMEISLNVTDDINMTLERWKKIINGKPPGPFVSSFFQNDEWRNKIINNKKNNNNDNNNNFNNLNNFYNVNNSTIKINFNDNINNSNIFNINNLGNNKNNNNFGIEQELKSYPKLYEKVKNNNNYKNNNSLQNNNYPDFEKNINFINNLQNNNNNNNNVNNNNISNNQSSFNLLIDFETVPIQNTSNNINTNLNLNLNDKNNLDKFVDFIAMTEKQNEINNKKNNNFTNISKNINNNAFNNKILQNNIINNNSYNYENKNYDNQDIERKFSNDNNNNNNSKINKSVVYPSFEELEQSNSNTNNNINSNQNQNQEDILSKFDF